MENAQIEERMRNLKKRGFITDSVREECSSCHVTAKHIYRVAGRGGGRDIHWCLACHAVSSFRRTSEDELVEDTGFDLDAFLSQTSIAR